MTGWGVERMIPSEVWLGLLTGKYKLYGGVIRWAAGTANAGQIVRHLIPVVSSPFDGVLNLVNTYQLHQLAAKVDTLSKATQQVLQLATGTMILSGLNLAVSAMGFVFLNKKLTKLEGKLGEIQKEIHEIRELLEHSERAELRAAIRDLLKIKEDTKSEHRHTILHNTRRSLAQINERYRELLTGAKKIETALAYEEYFCLTALAQCRCTGELGMPDIARQEIEEMGEFWKKESRRIANELLLGEHPERFLCSDFVQDVPVSVLAEWTDFAYEEEKGYDRIDELRSKTEPWYSNKSWYPKIKIPTMSNKEAMLKREKELIIPSLRKLVARNNVFQGHISQYELMTESNMKPSEFEGYISQLSKDSATEGYIILQPAK